MPTTLNLKYESIITVTVPNKIARELRKQKGAYPEHGDGDKAWSWGNKYGDIGYTDDKGEDHEIEGNGFNEDDIDYKRAYVCSWDDEEESVVDDSDHIECEKCEHVHAVGDAEACHESGDEGEKPVSPAGKTWENVREEMKKTNPNAFHNERECVACTDMYYYDEAEAEKGRCETTCGDCIKKADWGSDSDSDSDSDE
jgi:hypothetical protein